MLDALDQLDRVVDQVRVEVLDLLLRELDLVEPGDDLVVGQEALLETLLDEALELLDLRKGDIDGQHVRGTLLSRSNGHRHCRTATAPSRPACRSGSHHQARAS